MPEAHVTSPWPEKWYFREFPSLQTRAIRGTPGQPPYDFLKIQSLVSVPPQGQPRPSSCFLDGTGNSTAEQQHFVPADPKNTSSLKGNCEIPQGLQ